jgi:ubiquinone/menaquinone biosynthesis C-methylase UbiE
VAGDPFYKDHWINIDRDRLDRYERMFQWNPASSALYESADIRPGHIVADFGCGPGYTAIEIAKWVGPSGHVHAGHQSRFCLSNTQECERSWRWREDHCAPM